MTAYLGGLWFGVVFALRADRKRTWLAFLMTVVNSAAAALMALWIKLIIDGVVGRDRGAVATVAAVAGLQAGLQLWLNWVTYGVRIVVQEKTRGEIDRYVIRACVEEPTLERLENAEFLDRLEVVRQGRRALAQVVIMAMTAVGSLAQLAVLGVLLFGAHPLATLLILGSFVPVWTAATADRIHRDAAPKTAPSSRAAAAWFDQLTKATAAKELRVSGSLPTALAEYVRTSDEVESVLASSSSRAHAISAAGNSLFMLMAVGVIALVCRSVLSGSGDIGDAVLIVVLATQIAAQIQQLQGMASRYSGARAAIEALRQLAPSPRTGPAVCRVESNSVVRLDDVSFTYPGTDREVLSRVSLNLEPGTVTAIVGENGAGKTTLAKLVLGLYEPSSGSVSYARPDLAVSAAFQDFARFELLLREAVGVGDLDRITSDAMIHTAMQRADSEEELLALSEAGLETALGKSFSGGIEPSGGQWQRVALSRAFAKDTHDVLILDEPTASVDVETESALFRGYASASARSASTAATLLISHRLATTRNADKIYVLSEGRVVEEGTHEQLMSSGGVYASLFQLQLSGYE